MPDRGRTAGQASRLPDKNKAAEYANRLRDRDKASEYANRLLRSRIRILDDYGFYGLLLMHIIFALDDNCETAATDGKRIYFSPCFLDGLSDDELDFVLMHEILHIVLLHILRGSELDNDRFNTACDIVVNSNIMLERGRSRPIVLKNFGVAMHLAPDGKEGHLHTAEEVYAMLPPGKAQGTPHSNVSVFSDDHTRWGTLMEEDAVSRDVWLKRVMDAAEAVKAWENSKGRGRLPAFAERMIDMLKKPQIDWRTILNNFVQEEINDYSFFPPDRRFDESPFYLPEFSEKDESVRDILFMIDTSASMSDEEVTAAFSEVYGAVGQYGGRLMGKLGFFDAAIIEPVPFESAGELKRIKAVGGGGTDFQIIFEYVAQHMDDEPPVSIIIMTDGFAPFPEERLANGIPVLWLLCNDEVQPPWGKVARIGI